MTSPDIDSPTEVVYDEMMAVLRTCLISDETQAELIIAKLEPIVFELIATGYRNGQSDAERFQELCF